MAWPFTPNNFAKQRLRELKEEEQRKIKEIMIEYADKRYNETCPTRSANFPEDENWGNINLCMAVDFENLDEDGRQKNLDELRHQLAHMRNLMAKKPESDGIRACPTKKIIFK